MTETPHEDECRCPTCKAMWGRFWRNPEAEIVWWEQHPVSWNAWAAAVNPLRVTPSGAEVGSDGRI